MLEKVANLFSVSQANYKLEKFLKYTSHYHNCTSSNLVTKISKIYAAHVFNFQGFIMQKYVWAHKQS
jgi:hypothetical protein